jgi:hypothetical protein
MDIFGGHGILIQGMISFACRNGGNDDNCITP